jgi:hypothetical protein
MHKQIHIAWFVQPNARFPHYVMVHSKEIDGAAVNRGHEILEQGQATDDFTPIIFLDKSLDSPELRAQVQRDSINIPPPRR